MGTLKGTEFQKVMYEGYGPGGTAVVVACMTDNRNRTVDDLRSAFTRHGGNLGADGSVSYLFNEVGVLRFPRGAGRTAIREAAFQAGAEDVIVNPDGSVDVLTDPNEFTQVKAVLEQGGLLAETAGVTLRSSVNTTLDEKAAVALVKLLETLEDLDDVQNVYSNADIPAAILARL